MGFYVGTGYSFCLFSSCNKRFKLWFNSRYLLRNFFLLRQNICRFKTRWRFITGPSKLRLELVVLIGGWEVAVVRHLGDWSVVGEVGLRHVRTYTFVWVPRLAFIEKTCRFSIASWNIRIHLRASFKLLRSDLFADQGLLLPAKSTACSGPLLCIPHSLVLHFGYKIFGEALFWFFLLFFVTLQASLT